MARGEPSDASASDNVDDAITAVTMTLGIGAAGLSLVAAPVAASLGVAAGVLQLGQLVRRRVARRIGDVASGARERLGSQEGDAARRITEREDFAALAYQAVDASLLAHHHDQAVALGRVLGDALVDPPRVNVDEAAIVIEALRSLDLPHFLALRALAVPDAKEPGWHHAIGEALSYQDEAIVHAIGAALARAGAIELDPPGFGGHRMTAFGQRLLKYVDQDHRPATTPEP